MIASAMSSGVATRPRGAFFATIAGRPGFPDLAWISVSVVPAWTALTRMPMLPTSLDSPIVSVSTAPFDAA